MFVFSLMSMHATLQDKAEAFRETWAVYEDIQDAKLLHGPRRGDLRAAMAPFLANDTVGELHLLTFWESPAQLTLQHLMQPTVPSR